MWLTKVTVNSFDDDGDTPKLLTLPYIVDAKQFRGLVFLN
jgi:hypothetical protein